LRKLVLLQGKGGGRFFFLKDSFELLDPERQAQNELRRASKKAEVLFEIQKVLYYFIRRQK
jgi:hypothetical protein